MPEQPKAKNKNNFNHLERAIELNSKMLNPPPDLPQEEEMTPLNDIVSNPNAKWVFSESGATGSMLVTTNEEGTEGAAIKVDRPDTVYTVEKCSELMDSFLSKAKGPAPFIAPKVKAYHQEDVAQQPELVPAIQNKLESIVENSPDNESIQRRANKQLENLPSIPQGGNSLLHMDLAPGTMLTKLDFDDRVALYKSDAFAQNLGRSMPALIAVGMNDHLAPLGGHRQNNAANLMFDHQSCKIAVIDYSSKHQPTDPQNPGSKAGVVKQVGGDEEISIIRTGLAKALKSQEEFEKFLDSSASLQSTFLADTMSAFTQPSKEAGLFLISESEQVEAALNQEDKRRFAANLLEGTIEGIEYLQNNLDALSEAVRSTHEKVEGGGELEHFYTEKELEKFCAGVKKVDVPGLRAKFNERREGMDVARKETVNNRLAQINGEMEQIQEEQKRIQEKIDHLKKNPSMRERLSGLPHGGISGWVKDLNKKIAALDSQAAALQKEAHVLMNNETLYDHMKQQRQQAAASKQAAALEKQNSEAPALDSEAPAQEEKPHVPTVQEQLASMKPAPKPAAIEQDEQQQERPIEERMKNPGKLKSDPRWKAVIDTHSQPNPNPAVKHPSHNTQ